MNLNLNNAELAPREKTPVSIHSKVTTLKPVNIYIYIYIGHAYSLGEYRSVRN